jgi:hypothetical protein
LDFNADRRPIEYLRWTRSNSHHSTSTLLDSSPFPSRHIADRIADNNSLRIHTVEQEHAGSSADSSDLTRWLVGIAETEIIQGTASLNVEFEMLFAL